MFPLSKLSVRRRLVLALSVIAMFTLSAALVATYTFLSHREKLNRVIETEIPTLLIASEMSRVSETIASSASPVVNAINLLDVQAVSEQVLDRFAWMDSLVADLKHRGADPDRLKQLQDERIKVTENYLALEAAVKTLIYVRDKNNKQRAEFSKLIRQRAEAGVIGNGGKTAIAELQVIDRAAALHLAEALVAPDSSGLVSGKKSFEKLQDRLSALSTTYDAAELVRLSRGVNDFALQAKQYLEGRAEEKRLTFAANNFVDGHRYLSDRLNVAVADLVRVHRQRIDKTAAADDETLAYSGTILAILALLSITAVVAAAWNFDQNIAGRLQRLQQAMRNIAAGSRTAPESQGHGDEIGEMEQSLSSFVDTLKKQETALVEARNEAVAANRAKSKFLTNMSHELRTPLQAIIGFSEIIRTGALGPTSPKRYADYAADIHDSGKYLLDMINDILDLARIESGKTIVRDSAVNVASAVEDSVRLLEQQAKDADIALSKDVSQGLPSLRADPRMLMQICTNLITNAIHFTQPGGEIVVNALVDELGRLQLKVTDNGLGMTPGDIDNALAPFEYPDDARPDDRMGPGLGMPLTAELVRLHGALLDIDSKPGTGTTILVTFPADRVRQSSRPNLTVVDGSA